MFDNIFDAYNAEAKDFFSFHKPTVTWSSNFEIFVERKLEVKTKPSGNCFRRLIHVKIMFTFGDLFAEEVFESLRSAKQILSGKSVAFQNSFSCDDGCVLPAVPWLALLCPAILWMYIST